MIFFIGIVEDRNDPKSQGRVRVRIFGDHDADKTKIPTESLPFSQVMMPVTSASCGGIGQSATGIVEGSMVVGFYLDGPNKQTPLILGTLPGQAGVTGKQDAGFCDPLGIHPKRDEGPDTPYVATEFHNEHASTIDKINLRKEKIETAVPHKVTSVVQDEADSYYERSTWDMPKPFKNIEPIYPLNKVIESERGHVMEIDDSPGNERISTYHRSGTNEEYMANGDKTLTIVGSNYKAVYGADYIYIMGSANITVDGDMRHLVKGNYHLEVNGNKTELIHGTRQSKIKNSEHIEIGQDFASNVNGNYTQRVGLDETRLVDGLRLTTIGKTEDLTVTGETSITVMDKLNVFAMKDYSTTTVGKLTITSKGNIQVETPANYNTTVEGDVTNTIGIPSSPSAVTNNITGTQSDTVSGAVTETYGSTQNTTASGDITITGGPNINLNP